MRVMLDLMVILLVVVVLGLLALFAGWFLVPLFFIFGAIAWMIRGFHFPQTH
jgi:hypothetical protein